MSTTIDRDYVVLIWRIRRYLYGDLSEKAVRRYQRREVPLRRFRGVMAAYPLIDDTEELRDLDRWLVTQIWVAVRRRTTLLSKAGISPLPVPHGTPLPDLVSLGAVSTSTGEKIDLSIPSVRRIAKVIMKGAAQHGASAVGRARPYEY